MCLQIGESYSRERIPALFGAQASPPWQRSGFVWEGKNRILLVTLEKSGQPKEHQYEDRFLSPSTFQWQSQNRTTQRGKVGQAIRNHVKEGIDVHLFARRSAKRRSAKEGRETAPFFYCGPLTFQGWEGEKPITVTWSLQQGLLKKTLEHLAGSDPISR